VLELTFTGCKQIDDEGVRSLARFLPRGLSELRLHFVNCYLIGDAGAAALAEALPTSVMKLQATFRGTALDRNFKTASEMRNAFGIKRSWLTRVMTSTSTLKSSSFSTSRSRIGT